MKKNVLFLGAVLAVSLILPINASAKGGVHKAYDKYTDWKDSNWNISTENVNASKLPNDADDEDDFDNDVIIKLSEVPNPIMEYENLSELEKNIDFKPAVLPHNMDFVLDECKIIYQTLVSLQYENDKTGSDLMLRTQKNAGNDITGYQSLTYTTVSYVNGDYQFATYIEEGDTDYVTFFTKGEMSYAFIGENMTMDTFETCIHAVIDSL